MGTLIANELNYLYQQFGDPTLGFYYVDYKDAIFDIYGQITGGKTYLIKQCDLLGILNTDPLEIDIISKEYGLAELKEGAMFKVSTNSLIESGVMDKNGNWAIYDDPDTTIVEGILNKKFIMFKGEIYQIKAARKALIYKGQVSAVYFLTSKSINTTNIFGQSEVVIVNGTIPPIDPENRGEAVYITMANPSGMGWTDIKQIDARTPNDVGGVVSYFFITDIATIDNLSSETAFVIGDKVYNMTRTQQMTDGISDYKVFVKVNEELKPEDIKPLDSELNDITEGESVYFYHRKELWTDTYEEGRWTYKYEATPAKDKVSKTVVVGISSIPPKYRSDESVAVNLYSDNPDLFKVRSEESLSSTSKYVLMDAVAVRGVGHYVSNKVDIGSGKYRFELKKSYTFDFSDIPAPPQYGKITVKKTVTGVKNIADLKDYSVTISYNDSQLTLTAADFSPNGDKTFSASKTVEVLTGSYKVSESAVPVVAGYKPNPGTSVTSVMVSVTKDATVVAELVNSYVEASVLTGELEGVTPVTLKRRRANYTVTGAGVYFGGWASAMTTESDWGVSIKPPKSQYVSNSILSSLSNNVLPFVSFGDVLFNIYDKDYNSLYLPTFSRNDQKYTTDVVEIDGTLYLCLSAGIEVKDGVVDQYKYRFEMRLMPDKLRKVTPLLDK